MTISGFWEIFNDETEWLKTFKPEGGPLPENETPLLSEDDEVDELDVTKDVHHAIAKSEIEKIRQLWRQGYDVRTGKIYKLEPIIEGLSLFNLFVTKNWNEFNITTKIKLIEWAYISKLVNINNFWAFHDFSKAWQTLKTTIKYYINYKKSGSANSNIFLS